MKKEPRIKVAAESFGKVMLDTLRPSLAQFARTLVSASPFDSESDRQKAIDVLSRDFEKVFERPIAEFAEEILGMVDVTQQSTIHAVMRVIAEQAESVRSEAESALLRTVVRALEAGAWKKHVNPSSAERYE